MEKDRAFVKLQIIDGFFIQLTTSMCLTYGKVMCPLKPLLAKFYLFYSLYFFFW